mgnify:CR=1 FL=1
MKKMLLSIVAVMAMATGYAQSGNRFAGRDAARYDMTIDMRRLAAKLDLTGDQMEAVQVIHQNFSDEMSSAGIASGRHERRARVHQAVGKNVRQMQRVLNDKQFDTYMTLLGTTLHNRGL